MSKRFYVNYVNEIKCEKWNEFEKSIFSNVYKRAHDLVESIIKKNQKFSDKDDLRDYCNEKQIVNVVSFLGERGMGKSSAMLSFAFYLKHYDSNKTAEYGRYFITSTKADSLDFSVLSKIDVAMMMQGESLFDVILAKMWDEFSERREKMYTNSEYQYREITDKFEEVKKAYLRYKAAIKNADRMNDIAQLNELHELSKSLNLRNSFEALVDCYLKCMARERSEAYLVIPLDDLDMVIENVYDKLEEVRFLLTIPKVIVLLTADVNRMTLELNGHFSRKSLCGINVTEMEKERIRIYVANYLGKVLPRNMRIYMPTLKEIESEVLVLEDFSIINEIYKNTSYIDQELEIDKTFLICVAASLNIMAYPGQNNFLIRSNTLRNVVNSMSELFDIIVLEDNYEVVSEWLQKELNVGYSEVNHDDYSRLLYVLLGRSDQYYNEVLCHFLEHSREDAGEGSGYGVVIRELLAMKEKWPLEMIGRNLVLWIYAMAVNKAVREGDDRAESFFVKRDIFSSMIRPTTPITEDSMNIAETFSLRIKYKSNDEKTLTDPENVKMMKEIFNVLMFYNMEEIFKDLHLTLSDEDDDKNMKFYVIEADSLFYKISLDNLFYNAIHLDKYWRDYVKAIAKAVHGEPLETKELYHLLQAMSKEGLNLKTYIKWKGRYGISKVWDILPIQNVSVMMEISDRLKRFYERRSASLFLTGNFLDELIHIVIDVCKETEDYYKAAYMSTEKYPGTNKMLYSQKIEELYNMGVYKEVGDKINSILHHNNKDATLKK